MKMKCFLLVSIAATLLAHPFLAAGQDFNKKKEFYIKGGTVYTITGGTIVEGCLLIKEGKIHKVGRNLILPENVKVIDASGKWIMPGFVVAHTGSMAFRELIPQDRNPEIQKYLNPFDMAIEYCLASGITTYCPNPDASRYSRSKKKNYSFRNAVLKTTYGNLEEMFIKEPAYLFVDITALTLSEKDELRESFLKAGDYIRQRSEMESSLKSGDRKEPVLKPDIKLFVEVLSGDLPVRFKADKDDDIRKVLAFVDEFGINGQILGAAEGWLLADEIGRRNISTILQPEQYIAQDPYVVPANGSNIQNAWIQRRKGIKFAIIPTSPSMDTRIGGQIGDDLLTFPLAGAFAVRGGLSEKDALEALTIRPAELLGMAHRIGSLTEGKDADIIILDGNPLDYRTYVEYTIVNGEILYSKKDFRIFQKISKPEKLF